MPKYIYVLAIVSQTDDPGGIRFLHRLVKADDVEDAYQKGARLLGYKLDPTEKVANDYVAQID